ncbi:hypothetical protein TNCT_306971 [Trichonephila clavata]|uniref:Uncharacterized protein n=1 Tax=Trichonephila clavata TaxID=2740835 RepID=A0A8X6M1K8_TRICU|nr:hypothetical protein TNCT_306971 [Trichonephila clavata]
MRLHSYAVYLTCEWWNGSISVTPAPNRKTWDFLESFDLDNWTWSIHWLQDEDNMAKFYPFLSAVAAGHVTPANRLASGQKVQKKSRYQKELMTNHI